MDSRHSNPTPAAEREREIAVDANGIPQSNDPMVLASVIMQNRATIKKRWEELDRLTHQLESLGAQDSGSFTPDI